MPGPPVGATEGQRPDYSAIAPRSMHSANLTTALRQPQGYTTTTETRQMYNMPCSHAGEVFAGRYSYPFPKHFTTRFPNAPGTVMGPQNEFRRKEVSPSYHPPMMNPRSIPFHQPLIIEAPGYTQQNPSPSRTTSTQIQQMADSRNNTGRVGNWPSEQVTKPPATKPLPKPIPVEQDRKDQEAYNNVHRELQMPPSSSHSQQCRTGSGLGQEQFQEHRNTWDCNEVKDAHHIFQTRNRATDAVQRSQRSLETPDFSTLTSREPNSCEYVSKGRSWREQHHPQDMAVHRQESAGGENEACNPTSSNSVHISHTIELGFKSPIPQQVTFGGKGLGDEKRKTEEEQLKAKQVTPKTPPRPLTKEINKETNRMKASPGYQRSPSRIRVFKRTTAQNTSSATSQDNGKLRCPAAIRPLTPLHRVVDNNTPSASGSEPPTNISTASTYLQSTSLAVGRKHSKTDAVRKTKFVSKGIDSKTGKTSKGLSRVLYAPSTIPMPDGDLDASKWSVISFRNYRNIVEKVELGTTSNRQTISGTDIMSHMLRDLLEEAMEPVWRRSITNRNLYNFIASINTCLASFEKSTKQVPSCPSSSDDISVLKEHISSVGQVF